LRLFLSSFIYNNPILETPEKFDDKIKSFRCVYIIYKIYKMKNLFYMLCFGLLLVACSSSDDDDDMDDDTQNAHYSLIVNGDGLLNERFELSRDALEGGDIGLKFTSSDNDNNFLYFVLPHPIEISQYNIDAYNINNASVSSINIIGSGIYLSVDGTVTLTEVITGANCIDNYIGSLNINYRRQNDAPGSINVQGTFNVPLAHCE